MVPAAQRENFNMADIPANSSTTAVMEGNPQRAASFSGELEHFGDRDWIAVTLTAGQQYQIYMHDQTPGGYTNSAFRVLNAAGVEVATADAGGVGLNAFIPFTPGATGVFYIEVRNVNDHAGLYNVAVVGPDFTAPNDNLTGDPNQYSGGVPGSRILGGRGDDIIQLSEARDAMGDQGDDSITGTSSNNLIMGGLGDDTIYGEGGEDLLFGDEGQDDIFAGAGNDEIRSGDGADYVFAGSDQDTVYGGAGGDFIDGGDGNDVLDGGADGDLMEGNLGDDIFYVDSALDITEEKIGLAAGGTDTVISTVTRTLGNFIENLTLSGSANINASGNAQANILNGNSGNNILNGNAGADTMAGGTGNDIYYVDQAGDVTTELAGGGTDLVSTSVSRTLAANIENLNLSGSGNIDGNGNTQANIINGNSGNNVLRGYEGSDTLNGGGGQDTISGGTASDFINPGSDAVQDIIRFAAVGESTGSQRDAITGLDLNGEDKLDFTVTPGSIGFVNTGTLNLATINANLASAVNAALAVNGAVLFNPSGGDLDVAGHSFLVVDANGDGSYTANQDYVVQLINPTGTLTLDDFI
jgi:Ca2+-binding RTX toxin-like protein